MISKFSVKKPFTVLVAVILVLVLGAVSVTRMTPDLLPEMSFPYIVLVTTYIGAAPEEVENTVTKPMEQSLAALDDLKEISSVSSENVSVVYLTFEDTVNVDRAMLDIQQVVTRLKGDWPEAVGNPTSLELSTDLIPTVVAAVHYQDMDPVDLSGFVSEKLIPALEGTNGVASVNATGLVAEKIEIELNREKIDALNRKLYRAMDEKAQEAFDKIDEGQQKLDEGRQELEDAKAELEQGEKALQYGWYTAYQGFDEAKVKLDSTKEELISAIAMMEEQRAALVAQRDGSETQRRLLTALQESINLLEGRRTVLETSIAEIQSSDMTEEEKAAAVALPQAELDGTNQALAAIDQQLLQYGITRGQIPELLAQMAQLDEGIALLDENLAAAREGLAQVEGGYDELEKKKSEVTGQLSYAQKQLDEGRKQIETGATELDNGQQELDNALTTALDQLAAAKEAADLNNILTKELVAQLVQAQNFEMPAGYVNDGDVSWIVNVGDKVRGVEALEQVAILSLGLDGLDLVRLGDVADVHISDNSDTTFARINGENGVLLTFTRQSAYPTATVADTISERFRELESQYPGLRFVALMDQGDYIHMAMAAVVQSLLLGGALAILILFLFLRDIRPTFAVGISIPVSVLFALVLMYFSGVTMNVISMAGLAIGIGMLVDNSIVVIENIYRLRSEGVAPREAAIQGAREVMGAITASTLTTVCVFVPVLFVHGMTRQVFMDMILTITYSLVASLIVALTVIPAMAQGLLRRQVKPMSTLAKKLMGAFERSVRFTLRHRALSLLLALGLLGGSAYYSLKQGFEYFPESGGTQISITVTVPEDYTFSDRCFLADEMMASMEEVPHLTDIGGMIGGGMESLVGLSNGGGSEQITVYALVDENSGYSSIEAIKDIRQALEPYKRQADFEVSSVSTMSMTSMLQSGGFTMNIYSNDLDDLRTAAMTVADRLRTVEGLKDISGGGEDTAPALHITVDKEKAIEHNLTTAQVYLAIVEELTRSIQATQVTTSTNSLSATIHSADGETDRQKLEKMTVTATLRDGTTEEVPLSNIITVVETETLASIHRLEQRRYISVTATVADGYNVTLVSTAARKALEDVALPAGCQVEYAGENETIMDAMKDLFFMLLLGVLIIYLIMVAQFQSLLSPFIVIFTVPLAFTGGFLGLLISRFNMSIVSMVGMIMLVGVVVNNGIVLVDCANRLREEGLNKREAIVKATTMRIRPVLMTALTTILGLLPLGMGLGTGAEIIQPVAIVCIGGLTYATLMTVFIVPVLYDLLRRDRKPKASA